MIIWPIEFLYEENVEGIEAEKYHYLAKIGTPSKFFWSNFKKIFRNY